MSFLYILYGVVVVLLLLIGYGVLTHTEERQDEAEDLHTPDERAGKSRDAEFKWSNQ